MSDKQDIAWERERQLILESARRGFGHVEGISDTECLICALAARRRAYDDRVRERNEYRDRAAKAEAERDNLCASIAAALRARSRAIMEAIERADYDAATLMAADLPNLLAGSRHD